MRWTKWVAPMAALVLMAGIQAGQTRAADDAAAPDGKATVTVTVVDSAGKPVAGVTVGIAAAPASKKAKGATTQPDAAAAPKGKAAALETGVTGQDGTFALTKIPNGSYTVTAKIKKGGSGKSKVTIADDKDEAVSITLKAKATAAAAAPAPN